MKKIARIVIAVLLSFTLGAFVPGHDVFAAETSAPELFETHCSGCHLKGGNIIRRGKNLKLKTLQLFLRLKSSVKN